MQKKIFLFIHAEKETQMSDFFLINFVQSIVMKKFIISVIYSFFITSEVLARSTG